MARDTRRGGKKKVSKNIAAGVAHVNSSFNNTKILISDVQGNAISWSSAGTMGFKGFVTEMLRARLQEMSKQELENIMFYNCGPAPMVHAAAAVQREFCGDHQIHSAIDYLTKCGVGICGACATPEGKRICVDGPFIQGDPAPRS